MKTSRKTTLKSVGQALAIFSLFALSSLASEKPADTFLQEVNTIDQLVEKQLRSKSITPNNPASPEILLRRLYLDIAGRIPTFDEATSFLNSNSPTKQSDLINQLLNSPGYVHHYFHFWADLLRYKTKINNNTPGTDLYGDWIKQNIADNKPYDVMVRELIEAKGAAYEVPQVGFYTRDPGMPLDHMATTVQVFLGTRIQCAQCHDHPFDTWKQKDFYGMAAYTYGVKNKSGNKELEALAEVHKSINKNNYMDKKDKKHLRKTLYDLLGPARTGAFDANKKLKLPKDYANEDGMPGDIIEPKPLFGEISEFGDKRSNLADWMVGPDNDRFTKVIANRMWKKVMGIGLIEPVDDIKNDTVASNPALLEHLEGILIKSEYDLKHLLRVLHHTQTYRRVASVHDDPYQPYHFPGPVLRRMSAEQAWDSLMTLMVRDVDHAKPTLMGPVKAARSLTQSMQQRTGVVKDMSAYELESMLMDQAESAKAFYAQRSRLIAEKKKATKQDGKAISRKLSQLKKEHDAKIDSVFGERMPPMMMDDTPKQTRRERKKMAKQIGANVPPKTKKLFQQLVRASELPSPMYPGHFLRDFGQSDRNVIDNAHDNATVPQALALLNHWFYWSLAKHSHVRKSLEDQTSTQAALEKLFTSILSRTPGEREKTLLASTKQDNRAKSIQSTLWTLLNTREFLFIQ